MTRKELRKDLKERLRILITARHYKYYSQDLDEIAAVMGTSAEKIAEMIDTPEWLICCSYWGNKPKLGDIQHAERVWTQLVAFDEHTFPTEYPDALIFPAYNQPGDYIHDVHCEVPKMNALEMRQHKPDVLIADPFVVENLHDDQIRDYIHEERRFGYTPVPYENQHLAGYYWWLYPNYDGGVFSKVFAKVNIVGDLVCGAGENTHLVCIQDGKFVLRQQVSDDVVSVYDERLLVCL